MKVARDPRAEQLAPEPGQHQDDEHFRFYLRLIQNPDYKDDFDSVWLTDSLLRVNDDLGAHGYFGHMPEAEMIRHLRNGIAHGNRFHFTPRVIDRSTGKLRYLANTNREAARSGTPEGALVIDTDLQGSKVLWDWGGPFAILNCLYALRNELIHIAFDAEKVWADLGKPKA